MIGLHNVGVTFAARARVRAICPPAFAKTFPTPTPVPDARFAAGRPLV